MIKMRGAGKYTKQTIGKNNQLTKTVLIPKG